MPILMQVDELRAGMSLSRNLTNQYSVLLPHGRRLTDNDINALKRKFPSLTVQVADPLLDGEADFDDDSRDHEISRQVRHNVAAVVGKVSSTVRSGVTLQADHLEGMENVVDNMLQYINDNPVTMAIVDQSNSWDDYLQEHSANVFYLSVLLGNSIRNYVKRERERLSAAKTVRNAMNLTPLAAGALFHDLGMGPLESLYHKAELLSEQEIEQVRAHPTAGADMLPESIDPMVRMVVRCHHENHNGSGYPQQLAGDKINIFARIVRLADSYSAGIATKVYSKAKPSVVVLHEMLCGGYHKFYDPIILKVFGGLVPPFPIGSKLKLSNNKWAVVVRYNRDNLFDPAVIIAFDELGDPLSKEQLAPAFFISERPDLKLLSFGQTDLSFLHETPQSPAEPEPVPKGQEQLCEMFDLAYP